MIDLMQLDSSLRKFHYRYTNDFYVINIKTDEILGMNLSHSEAIRLCMKDFNNRTILKGA